MIWFLVSLEFACAQVKGTYINTAEPNKEIFFDHGTFVFRYNNYQTALPLYYCNDTIAYGYWSKVKNQKLLELSSEDSQFSLRSDIEVKERKNDKTQIFSFIVKSPIEVDQERFNKDVRIVEYGIELRSNCIEYQGSLINQRFPSNEFSILVPTDCSINSFLIYVYPTDFLKGWQEQYPRVIQSFLYKIKYEGSNVFEVDLPDLTYCYVNAMRLKQDYVFLESEELLKWNGQLYKKK